MASRPLHTVLSLFAASRIGQSAIRQETLGLFKAEKAFKASKKTEAYTDAAEQALLGQTEVTQVVTSVKQRLAYDFKKQADFLNISAAVDAGNCKAFADVIIDGTTVLSRVPATTLLSLQGQLSGLIKLIEAAPTRDSKTSWVRIEGEQDLFERETPRITAHNKEKQVPIIVHPGTEKHAPQAQLVKEHVTFKVTTESERSSAFTSMEKSDLLARVSSWNLAVTEALSVANATVVEEATVGSIITQDLLAVLNK